MSISPELDWKHSARSQTRTTKLLVLAAPILLVLRPGFSAHAVGFTAHLLVLAAPILLLLRPGMNGIFAPAEVFAFQMPVRTTKLLVLAAPILLVLRPSFSAHAIGFTAHLLVLAAPILLLLRPGMNGIFAPAEVFAPM